MFSLFVGAVLGFVLVYLAMVVAYWVEDKDTSCWYCRVLKALSWPYEVIRYGW